MKNLPLNEKLKDSNIETLRFFAVFTLVSFHTIGVTQQDSLQVAYPHPLRYMADGLTDIRMPLFAFISGWVYSQRAVDLNGFSHFFRAKIHRLYVPGVVAALTFWIFSTFIVSDSVGQGAPIREVLLLSYVHYWFLQAILLILISIAFIEAIFRKPLEPFWLISAALLFLMLPQIYVPGLMLTGAHYLAPFFIFGVLVARRESLINQYRIIVTILALVATGWGLGLNLEELRLTGSLSVDERDLQSALLSLGIITLLKLYLPNFDALSGFGPLAFTIYLYHVFGTSGMRRAAQAMEIESTWLVYALCVVAGFGVPYIFHSLCSRIQVMRVLFIGLRPKIASKS